MYLSEVESVGVASEKKIQLLKRNFLGYFISAITTRLNVTPKDNPITTFIIGLFTIQEPIPNTKITPKPTYTPANIADIK